MPTTTTKTILLVEDNPADIMMVKKTVGRITTAPRLVVAQDGVEAVRHLQGNNHQSHTSKLPDLVLLDLNLPRVTGREVLEEAKADTVLTSIPIIVLTSSESDEDIRHAFEYGANAYLIKPPTVGEWRDLAWVLEQHWFIKGRLP